MGMADRHYIYGRAAEIQCLRQMLEARRSFLLHGRAGVGKTVITQQLASESPNTLYSPHCSTSRGTFSALASELVRCGDKQILKRLGGPASALEHIRQMSAVSLRGVVTEALRQGEYCIALDGLHCPSQSFAASVRELARWTSTPVMAIARSTHMEDIGFLRAMFSDRKEQYALRNFEPETALAFAQELVTRFALKAANLNDLVAKIAKLSEGNPGAIVCMLQMAQATKYRMDGQVALSPLYIDFRLGRVTTNA